MPVRIYFDFLARFPAVSREYAVLRNSHLQPDPAGDYNVEILCGVRDTELLLDSANRFCAEAVPYIQLALASVYANLPVEELARKCSQWMNTGEQQDVKRRIVFELLNFVRTLLAMRQKHGRQNVTVDFYEIRVRGEIVAVNLVPHLLAECGVNIDDNKDLLESWTKI